MRRPGAHYWVMGSMEVHGESGTDGGQEATEDRYTDTVAPSRGRGQCWSSSCAFQRREGDGLHRTDLVGELRGRDGPACPTVPVGRDPAVLLFTRREVEVRVAGRGDATWIEAASPGHPNCLQT